MRKIRSYGSVRERGGNEPLYSEEAQEIFIELREIYHYVLNAGSDH